MKRWTDEEVQFLFDNYMTMTQRQMAEALGRTYDSVHEQMRLMRLGKRLPDPRVEGQILRYTNNKIVARNLIRAYHDWFERNEGNTFVTREFYERRVRQLNNDVRRYNRYLLKLRRTLEEESDDKK